MTPLQHQPLEENSVCVGVVTGAHGIKGFVKIKPFVEDVDCFSKETFVFSPGYVPIKIKVKSASEKGIMAEIQGVTTRNQAEDLKGVEIYVSKDSFEETEEDEFYYFDLIGLTAKTVSGAIIGDVVAVDNYGAQDILFIQNEEGQEILIPFIDDAVPEVDLENKILIVHENFIMDNKES